LARQEKKGGKGRGRRASPAPVRGRLNYWAKRTGAFILVIVLVPVLLVPVYGLGFVHPVSTLMLGDLLTLKGYDRQWVSLNDVAPVAVHSVMMSEDGRFCEHGGIDWRELDSVIDQAMEGEKTRGASTIVMQTGKNLFLWSGRSYLRKAIELPLALYLDLVLSKKRIMEIYLNIAEWGPGIYGIEAASQYRFKRPASELSRRQAALLAVTLPAPETRNPAKPTKGLLRLAGIIERRARQAGAYVGCLK
jgi:monofunctional biosynthetic peptidoglycan transglycosylase